MFFCIVGMLSTLFYVNDPVVNVRAEPTRASRITSSGIFSEKVFMEKDVEDWAYIRLSDQSEGWVPKASLVKRDKPYNPSLCISRLAAHVYGVQDTEFGPIKTLPYGAKLQAVEPLGLRWIAIVLPDGQEGFVQKGDVEPESELHHKSELVAFSQKFLGLPYTWGGRSSFGYDCSGFVQMLYGQIRILLPRNSHQQVVDSRFKTIRMEELEPGDLIFFGKDEGHIGHVALYLGNGQCIHATVREEKPWIRISTLSDFDCGGGPGAVFPFRIAKQLVAPL